MDAFKNFASAMDRQIERKRFNPNLTHGEYNALSEAEQWEWSKQLMDYWAAKSSHNLQWDYEQSGISSVAFDNPSNGELGS